MQKTVLVGQDEYNVQEDATGMISLLRFNPTFKMWVELEFGENLDSKKIKQAVSTILTENVLQGIEKKGLKPIEDTGIIPPEGKDFAYENSGNIMSCRTK